MCLELHAVNAYIEVELDAGTFSDMCPEHKRSMDSGKSRFLTLFYLTQIQFMRQPQKDYSFNLALLAFFEATVPLVPRT